MTADKNALLREALPILQEFARLNPQHEYKGTKQDPRGVHSLVDRITAALAEPHGVVVPVEMPESFAQWLESQIPPSTVISNPRWWAPKIYRALLAAAKEPQGDGWIKCSERLPEKHRKLLVTNNIKAKDAHGEMSHVWLVNMIHQDDDAEGFCAYTDDMMKLHGITHYKYPLPPLPRSE